MFAISSLRALGVSVLGEDHFTITIKRGDFEKLTGPKTSLAKHYYDTAVGILQHSCNTIFNHAQKTNYEPKLVKSSSSIREE